MMIILLLLEITKQDMTKFLAKRKKISPLNSSRSTVSNLVCEWIVRHANQ